MGHASSNKMRSVFLGPPIKSPGEGGNQILNLELFTCGETDIYLYCLFYFYGWAKQAEKMPI